MLQHIHIPGATLSVAEMGRGTPILFVHGFPLDHTMWRHQVGEFVREFRCIAPDLRGFGKSSVTEGTVTMAQFADDLAAVLDDLEVTEPVILCGLSMGGYIAFEFVRRHAQRLRALILCDTRAAPDTPEAAANRRKLAEDVVAEGPEAAVKAMLPRLFPEGLSVREPAWVQELRHVMLASDPFGIAAAARGMAERTDARPLLASIACPTLVLVGEHDAISPPSEMRDMAAAIPGATFRTIPQAGHIAPLENPAAVNAALREFLSGLQGR